MTYQDIWLNGEVRSKGQRECESRWRAISAELRKYKRRFTLLDVGAAEGYFAIRAATEFDCVVVAVDQNKNLLKLAEESGLTNLIVLSHRISITELEALGECEHFDVVLALNVLHHFPGDVERVVGAIMGLGDETIVETPPPSDKGACGQGAIPILYRLLMNRSRREIAATPSHTADVVRPMNLYWTRKKGLTRAYIDMPKHVPFAPARVYSTDTYKSIYLKGKRRPWIHGINLRTYQRLTGCYPSPEYVASKVKAPADGSHHGDIRPWNFILDGRDLHLIDGDDGRAIYDDDEGVKMTVDALKRGAQSS